MSQPTNTPASRVHLRTSSQEMLIGLESPDSKYRRVNNGEAQGSEIERTLLSLDDQLFRFSTDNLVADHILQRAKSEGKQYKGMFLLELLFSLAYKLPGSTLGNDLQLPGGFENLANADQQVELAKLATAYNQLVEFCRKPFREQLKLAGQFECIGLIYQFAMPAVDPKCRDAFLNFEKWPTHLRDHNLLQSVKFYDACDEQAVEQLVLQQKPDEKGKLAATIKTARSGHMQNNQIPVIPLLGNGCVCCGKIWRSPSDFNRDWRFDARISRPGLGDAESRFQFFTCSQKCFKAFSDKVFKLNREQLVSRVLPYHPFDSAQVVLQWDGTLRPREYDPIWVIYYLSWKQAKELSILDANGHLCDVDYYSE